MLTKIENREIMTKRQAKEKYATKHFIMIMTTEVDKADRDFGYVLYTADETEELLEVPREEYIGKVAALTLGIAAESEMQIGDICYEG